jgi:hypothetical protein
MMVTRSRTLEVLNRCARAVNFLSYATLSAGPPNEEGYRAPNEYGYRMGMLSPEEEDLLFWLVSFIVLSATRTGPPEGDWVEEEARVLMELFDDGWAENVAPHLPPMLDNYVSLFQDGERTWGDVRLIRACQERTNFRDVLLRVGFWVVDGARMFHMPDRRSVVEESAQEYVSSSASSSEVSEETSYGYCPQFDSDGHYIETSMENSPESETEEDDTEEGDEGREV